MTAPDLCLTYPYPVTGLKTVLMLSRYHCDETIKTGNGDKQRQKEKESEKDRGTEKSLSSRYNLSSPILIFFRKVGTAVVNIVG